MARRVSWTNNSTGHAGTYVYRAETLDPQNLPAPVATVDPVAQGETAEWIDSDALSPGDYDYAVQDFDGQGMGALSVISTHTIAADYSAAQIGDEIGGGIYGGTHGNGTETWHLIFAKQAGESSGLKWGTRGTNTGAHDIDDGKANQDLVLSSFDDGSTEAFYYCRDYVDGQGNNDYYLPARNELAKADALVAMPHAEFSTNLAAYRWSSTQYYTTVASYNAWARRFSDGNQRAPEKNELHSVRPVRRVPV